MQSGAPLVHVKRLRKVYPVHRSKRALEAVSDVSFAIYQGERIGLIGESGSGKTTVGRCLLRLTDVTSGKIEIDSARIDQLTDQAFIPFRARMLMVFQDPLDSLDPRLNVRQIIAEPLRYISRLTTSAIDVQINRIMDEVALDHRLSGKKPGELTAGQAQRVVIARAIVTNPDFVVLDEPTSALDMRSRANILELLLNLQSQRELTYLLISHDLTSVRHFCTRILVMYLGMIVEGGTTEEIFEKPKHPYTKALLASFLPADPDVQRGEYRLHGEIPSPIDRPPGCPLVGRCPEEIADCSKARPDLTNIGEQHTVACYVAGTPLPSDEMASDI